MARTPYQPKPVAPRAVVAAAILAGAVFLVLAAIAVAIWPW